MQQSGVLRRALDAAHHLSDECPPWQDLLQGFCDLAGSDSANFIMCDAADQLLLLERRNGDPSAERDYLANWHAHDFMTPMSRGFATGAWLDSQQMFTKVGLARNAFYNEFMVAHQIRQIAVLVVESSPTQRAALSIQRSKPTDRMLDIVKGPELRAFAMAVEQGIAQRRANATSARAGLDASVEHFGEAAFLVSVTGAVLHASPSTAAWLDQRGALALVAGRLQHRDPARNLAWRKALIDAGSGRGAQAFMLPGVPGRAYRLDIVRADKRFSLRGEPLLLVKVGRDRLVSDAAAPLFRAAFGVSPMEAEVLACLVVGRQPKQIAAMHKVQISTVRTQIASLMLQLGCKRQADLVRVACALL